MKLVIFSDIHYAPELPINNGSVIEPKLIQYSEDMLNKLIDKVNNDIKPDLVVNLGDLVEDFFDHDMDIINITYVWQILQGIKPPFYSLAGNHDLRSMNSRVEVENIMGYNHSTFSIDFNGCHFIFLGLDVNPKTSAEFGGILKAQSVSKEDINWLKEDLKNTQLPTLIFSHYGIAEDDMVGNWWFEKHPNHALLANRKEVKEIFKNSENIIGVFSGHQHWTKRLTEDGINYYVVGSLIENINNDGIPDGVYLEVDVEKEKSTIREHHIVL